GLPRVQGDAATCTLIHSAGPLGAPLWWPSGFTSTVKPGLRSAIVPFTFGCRSRLRSSQIFVRSVSLTFTVPVVLATVQICSCAEGAGGPPPRNTLIPTSATTNLRMVIRSSSSPSFDEERSRLLLLSDRLLRVPPSEEETPDGLVLEPPCLPEVGDGLRVKAAAPQHPDAVVRLASGAGEQSLSLRGGYGAARLQQLDALSDVLEHVDDPQESGDR